MQQQRDGKNNNENQQLLQTSSEKTRARATLTVDRYLSYWDFNSLFNIDCDDINIVNNNNNDYKKNMLTTANKHSILILLLSFLM